MLTWFTDLYAPSTSKGKFSDLTMDQLKDARRLIDQEISNRSIRENDAKAAMNPLIEVTGFIGVEIHYSPERTIVLSFVEGMTDKCKRVTLDVTPECIEDICKLLESNGIKTKITKYQL